MNFNPFKYFSATNKANDKQIQLLTAQISELMNKLEASDVKAPSPSIQKTNSRLYRAESDLKDYIQALTMAEDPVNPTFYKLVGIQKGVSENGAVSNALDIRKSYILAREHRFKYKDTGESNDLAVEFFRNQWFDRFQELIIDSKMEGFKLIKLGNIVDSKLTNIEDVQSQNVNPFSKLILNTPYSREGVNFESDELKDWYILLSDNTSTYQGVFTKVTPYALIHKVSLLAQNDYMLRFGSPNILVKTDINNTEVVNEIVRYLENFNSSSYSIANLQDQIELIQASGQGSEIYSELEAKTEELIQRLILGSPLASEKSFVGTAEIRQSISNLFSLKDIKSIEHYVNNELLPRLVRLGLTFLDNTEFEIDKNNKIDPSILFTQVIQLIQSGQFTVDPDWIKETFGIPVEANQLFKSNPETGPATENQPNE